MNRYVVAISFLAGLANVPAAHAEAIIWGVQVEQAEYRVNEDVDVLAWDFDALVGSDELKAVWRSEAEYELKEDAFETLENQLRLQTPISDFFDAVAGIRFDTPAGHNRVYGVLGFHGLAEQWIEVDADLFLSDHPAVRFEAEYEGLITNYITLTPSIEIDIPLVDDRDIGQGAFAPTIELGARISYDLIDRSFSPYIGIHFEQSFGETANLARAEGEDAGEILFTIGAKIMF